MELELHHSGEVDRTIRNLIRETEVKVNILFENREKVTPFHQLHPNQRMKSLCFRLIRDLICNSNSRDRTHDLAPQSIGNVWLD
ncbi:MAG: hypothetical protein ACI814_001713 [Mariniblastus sp.]|jgi:hypothetical protein